MTSSGYATLRMCLRPPRVAVVFDGGPQWHYWARVALRACTKVWGGEGFVLVPHHDGAVHPRVLDAVRAYDPDYVLTLERTIRTVESATPGALTFHNADGEMMAEEEGAKAVLRLGDEPVSYAADETARLMVAGACSPHRRRHADPADSGWEYRVTEVSANGVAARLTPVAALTDQTPPAQLSPPPAWGGPLGVMAAALFGIVDEPVPGDEPALENTDRRNLIWRLLHPHAPVHQLPSDLVRHSGKEMNVDPNSVPTAFKSASLGLTWISRGYRSRGRMLVSVGDEAEDFALALVHQRLYGAGVWIPLTWWTSDQATGSAVRFALSSAVSWHVHRRRSVFVSTTATDSAATDDVLAALRRPTAWAEGNYDREVQRLTDFVTVDSGLWPRRGVRYLAVEGQFDQDYAVPVIRNDVDDIEMIVPCPVPAVTQPELATCDQLRWQVDVELVEASTPLGRGLDGHTLYADSKHTDLTWIRSSRDAITYESERFDFIAAGTPKSGTLARPRLRAPSLTTWSKVMAEQAGKQVRLSGAGRTAEVLRRLWGDRASLAADFSGPLLPVLRTFTPTNKKARPQLDETEGVVLPTGAGEQHLYEAYLTFRGMICKATAISADELRTRIDGLLQKGVLRRGLILGCAQCGRPAFRSIDEVGQVNQCPRCGAANNLTQQRWRKPVEEPYWYYDLHPSVREHLAQDGDIPLQLSQQLRSTSRSHIDIAELELLDATGSPEAEADLIALSDGDLIIAEAKRPGTLGTGKELRRCVAKRAAFADVLCVDQIVIATADQQFDNASIQALCKEVQAKPWRWVRPRVRVVCGLGTDTVTDTEVDLSTDT